MSDLVAFLRTRLAEDAEIAEAAAGATWNIGQTQRVEWGPVEPWTNGRGIDVDGRRYPQTWTDTHSHICASAPESRMVADMSDGLIFRSRNVANAEHIARWDPARALVEVKAKRAMINWCTEVIGDRDLVAYGEFGSLSGDPNALAVTLAVESLRLLTLPYADHPDYDPAWAVETADGISA